MEDMNIENKKETMITHVKYINQVSFILHTFTYNPIKIKYRYKIYSVVRSFFRKHTHIKSFSTFGDVQNNMHDAGNHKKIFI